MDARLQVSLGARIAAHARSSLAHGQLRRGSGAARRTRFRRGLGGPAQADPGTRESHDKVEELRHQLKKGSEEVGRLRREKKSAEAATAQMKALGDRIRDVEE